MRYFRQYRQMFARLPGLLLAIASLATIPKAAAQEDYRPAAEERIPPAVEALRDALRVPEPAEKEDAAEKKVYLSQLDFRRKSIQEHINALRGVRELYLALSLQEWRDETLNDEVSKIDRALRQEVEERFTQTVRASLKSAQPSQQIAAADLLGEIGIKIRGTGTRRGLASALAPDLAALLKDKNPGVVGSAAKALGHVNPDPEVAGPALQVVLQTGSTAEKRAAAEALVSLIQTLVQLAKSSETKDAETARDDALTLALCQAVTPVAGRGLKDPDVTVRRQCALAIQKVGATLADLIAKPEPASYFPPAGRELSGEDKTRIQDYQQRVDKDLQEMSGVARALADQGRALGALLHDADKATRLQAAQALVEMANAQIRFLHLADSVPASEPRTKVSGDEPRTKASSDEPPSPQAALKRGLIAALPDLAHALGDPDRRVRLAAVSVLDMMDREAVAAVDALRKALRDSDIFVRWAAARALGNIDPTVGKVAVPELGRLLFDPDLDPRLAAATTLEHYGNQAGAAVGDLTRAIGVGDAEIRVAVIHALEAIGPEAKAAVPALAKALGDPDDTVRRAAADALGRFGPLAQSAEPALRKALDDKEPIVRKAASGALLNINQK